MSAIDAIDPTDCEFSEKLSRKVLNSLRSLNDSLGEVRESVSRIDLLASNNNYAGSPGSVGSNKKSFFSPLTSAPPRGGGGGGGGGGDAGAGSGSGSGSGSVGAGVSSSSSSSSSSDAADRSSSPGQVDRLETATSIARDLAFSSLSAGVPLAPTQLSSLRKVVDPATMQELEAAQYRAQTQPPPVPGDGEAANQTKNPSFASSTADVPASMPSNPPAPRGGADEDPSVEVSTPSRAPAAGTDAPPSTARRVRSSGSRGDGDGDGDGDGEDLDGALDGSDESDLEEEHLTDVQFFALEEEGAEIRAAKAQLMALKAEHEAEKRSEAGLPAEDGAGAGAGAGGSAAPSLSDAPIHVGDAEWPVAETSAELGPIAPFEAFNLRIVHEAGKTGFEELKDFQAPVGTVIAGRFQVRDYLGSAAFSTALSCYDLVLKRDVCLKVIRNNKDFLDQSLDEIKLLRYINSMGDADTHHVLRMYEYFYHKEHLIIVTELLKDNLYEFQKYLAENNHEPYFTLPRLQRIAKQVLEALVFIHGRGLLHCDLKPENLLISSYSRCEVKVIDFGSSCFIHDHLSSYIQSRSYRAPEVILGLPYDHKIDIWSFGCILSELLTGKVLFPNDTIQSMLARMIGVFGKFPDDMITRGKDVSKYFNSRGVVYERTEDGGAFVLLQPKKTSLRSRLKCDDDGFMSFISTLLTLDPSKRPTAAEALKHPWLSASLDYEPYVLPQ